MFVNLIYARRIISAIVDPYNAIKSIVCPIARLSALSIVIKRFNCPKRCWNISADMRLPFSRDYDTLPSWEDLFFHGSWSRELIFSSSGEETQTYKRILWVSGKCLLWVHIHYRSGCSGQSCFALERTDGAVKIEHERTAVPLPRWQLHIWRIHIYRRSQERNAAWSRNIIAREISLGRCLIESRIPSPRNPRFFPSSRTIPMTRELEWQGRGVSEGCPLVDLIARPRLNFWIANNPDNSDYHRGSNSRSPFCKCKIEKTVRHPSTLVVTRSMYGASQWQALRFVSAFSFAQRSCRLKKRTNVAEKVANFFAQRNSSANVTFASRDRVRKNWILFSPLFFYDIEDTRNILQNLTDEDERITLSWIWLFIFEHIYIMKWLSGFAYSVSQQPGFEIKLCYLFAFRSLFHKFTS